MLNRWVEDGLLDTLGDTRRRLHRVLAARPGHAHRPVPGRDPGGFPGVPGRVAVHGAAHRRGAVRTSGRSTRSRRAAVRSLAQLALAWALRDERVTSVLVGASSVHSWRTTSPPSANLAFDDDELTLIEQHAVDSGINLWSPSSAV